MPHASRLAVILSLLALSACQRGPIAMTDTPDSTATRDAAKAGFRRNPNPREAYRITMRIEDAPGPFASMRAFAQYDVVNPECLPPPNDNNGHTWPVPTDAAEIKLTRDADGSYSGVVYADYMLDEDYHGRGVCKWQLIQAQAQLKATGVPGLGETSFIPELSLGELQVESSKTINFAKQNYPATDVDLTQIPDYEYSSFGQVDRSKMAADLTDDDVFQIHMSAKKISP